MQVWPRRRKKHPIQMMGCVASLLQTVQDRVVQCCVVSLLSFHSILRHGVHAVRGAKQTEGPKPLHSSGAMDGAARDGVHTGAEARSKARGKGRTIVCPRAPHLQMPRRCLWCPVMSPLRNALHLSCMCPCVVGYILHGKHPGPGVGSHHVPQLATPASHRILNRHLQHPKRGSEFGTLSRQDIWDRRCPFTFVPE